MQTRNEYAAYVENNDFIVDNGEVIGYVYAITEDTPDFITFDVVDEDGEHYNYRRAPFDEIPIVESFEDDDECDACKRAGRTYNPDRHDSQNCWAE